MSCDTSGPSGAPHDMHDRPVGVCDPDEQVWLDHLRDEAAFDGHEPGAGS